MATALVMSAMAMIALVMTALVMTTIRLAKAGTAGIGTAVNRTSAIPALPGRMTTINAAVLQATAMASAPVRAKDVPVGGRHRDAVPVQDRAGVRTVVGMGPRRGKDAASAVKAPRMPDSTATRGTRVDTTAIATSSLIADMMDTIAITGMGMTAIAMSSLITDIADMMDTIAITDIGMGMTAIATSSLTTDIMDMMDTIAITHTVVGMTVIGGNSPIMGIADIMDIMVDAIAITDITGIMAMVTPAISIERISGIILPMQAVNIRLDGSRTSVIGRISGTVRKGGTVPKLAIIRSSVTAPAPDRRLARRVRWPVMEVQVSPDTDTDTVVSARAPGRRWPPA